MSGTALSIAAILAGRPRAHVWELPARDHYREPVSDRSSLVDPPIRSRVDSAVVSMPYVGHLPPVSAVVTEHARSDNEGPYGFGPHDVKAT